MSARGTGVNNYELQKILNEELSPSKKGGMKFGATSRGLGHVAE